MGSDRIPTKRAATQRGTQTGLVAASLLNMRKVATDIVLMLQRDSHLAA